jgi:hypothetical protein
VSRPTVVNDRIDQLELFKAHADGIDEAFWKFRKDNPQIYQLLVRFARQAKQAGRTRFGMKMLFERVRWYTVVETNDPTGLKINNNYTSRFARLLDRDERCSPQCRGCADPECLAGMFEMRELHTRSELKEPE